jgi:HupE / UreJ protein
MKRHVPSVARGAPTIRRAIVLGATLLVLAPGDFLAHDIPATVLVRAFVKPEGSRLHVLVRVPLVAMRDIDFPARDSGRYLDIPRADSLLSDAARTWIVNSLELYENDARLGGERIAAARLSLPSDRSFDAYPNALAHLGAPPLADTIDIPWQQALMDLLIDYPITSAESRFSIRPELARLAVRTTTVLRFLPPGRPERDYEYIGDPGLVRLDPRWHQAALRFVDLGFHHILDGIDHLLFILCLVIPYRRIRPLIGVVTAFTVAHSVTLIASAAGLAPSALWFPPLIEMLIALSIVYMALENIVGAKLRRRWLIAFGFGLVHGFGFSFALRESLQFAGTHLLTSLLSFNVGVELGQFAVLAVLIPVLNLVFRRVVEERMGTIILSALVAHTAWHWMADRWRTFREFHVAAPAFDLALVAAAMRWLMLALILVSAAWGLSILVRRLSPVRPSDESATDLASNELRSLPEHD